MRDTTDTLRPHGCALAIVAAGVLLAGCGGSSSLSRPVASGGASSSAGASASAAASHRARVPRRPTPQRAGTPSALAFAKCIRAHGVPNFPDPTSGGGFTFNPAGVNRSAPAVRAALAACQPLMPLPGGPGGPTYSGQVTARSLSKLRRIAVCMRAHGIAQFPDPTLTRPRIGAGAGVGVITDFDGVFLSFPATLDIQSPAYRQALTSCGAPPLGLPH
jgi:hypothetical protein